MPDGNVPRPALDEQKPAHADRIARAGYPKNTGQAENIAAGQPAPSAVVQGWMNSAGHKKNMLNCSYKSIGVGYAHNDGTRYRHYWVQTFGTR